MYDLNKIRPAWLEINLDNLTYNYKELRKIVDKKSKFMAVVKCNAYCHGSIRVAQLYSELGVDYLGVAMLTEAVELRKSGVKLPILVLGYIPQNQRDIAVTYDITQTIYNIDDAKYLSDIVSKKNQTAKIHIKIDSGMGRIGFLPNDSSIEEIIKISQLPNLELEGIFTHFATADELDKTYTKSQYEQFTWIVNNLKERNVEFKIKHVSNGPALLDMPEYNLDMVRCGIMLYGIFDSDEVKQERVKLKKTIALKAKVSNVKKVPINTSISYGQTFKTTRESVIATIPIGYADGYPRMLSGKGYVCINNKKAPIVGRICMDQMMIDVTDAGKVNIDDEVTLIGTDNENCLQWEEIASMAGTIHAEVLSDMNRRIPRVYMKDNKIDSIKDYLLDL